MAEKKDRKPARGGRAAKTNKTAHVLSLLTDVDEVNTEAAAETEAAPSEVAAPAPAPAPAPPVLEVVRANDDAISGKIKEQLAEALEQELAEEMAEEAPEVTEPPAPEEAPAIEPSAPAEAEAAPAQPAPEAAAAPEPAAPKPPAPAPAQPTFAPSPQAAAPTISPAEAPRTQVKGLTCMNVMQALVVEKADKYIEKFGLCDCPRCRIDVIALALTNLPAKYVVVRDSEAIPMLTVYEGRYNAAVISQVMWACKRVIDFPRH